MLMRKLLTTDGKEVPWPFSRKAIRCISLTETEVQSLRNPSAIERIMAHEHLSNAQLINLYSRTAATQQRGFKARRVARRIRELDIVDLCTGIGEARICNICTNKASAAEIREALLQEIARPSTVTLRIEEEDDDDDE